MKQKLLLAHFNVARLVADPDDARVAPFMNALGKVSGVAKRSAGFVWMKEGSGEPNTGNTDAPLNDDPREVANLSVWRDLESLEAFTWKTVHAAMFARREEWFEMAQQAGFVMWWIAPEERPTVPKALERLDYLRQNGDSDYAFGWAYAASKQTKKQASESGGAGI